MNIKTAALAAALVAALGLAGCETATPFQPLVQGGATAGGFTDQRLDDEHYRVTFQGNSVTSRTVVENYLLYRAAQLTVQSGFDWFQPISQRTDVDWSTFVTSDPFWGPGWGWSPAWRWGGAWGGWGPWGPWGGGGAVTVQNTQRFQASADIVMQHGAKPPHVGGAFDARAVMTNLGPTIVLPQPRKS